MTKKFYEFTRTEDGRLETITIPGDGPLVELNPKGSEGYRNIEKFLIAATDYFNIGKYNHPQTMPGLHIYSTRPLIEEAELVEFYGAVSIDFNGKYGIPIPDQQEYPEGWAELHKDGSVWKLTHRSLKSYEAFPKEDGRASWCRKHRMVDRMVRGCRFEARVLPVHKLAEKLMKQWEMPLKAAIAARNKAFAENDVQRVMNSGLVREYKEVGGSIPVTKQFINENGEPNGGLLILTVDGEHINTAQIPEGTVVSVVAGGTEVDMIYDGSYHAQARLRMVQLNEKQGWAIKVK